MVDAWGGDATWHLVDSVPEFVLVGELGDRLDVAGLRAISLPCFCEVQGAEDVAHWVQIVLCFEPEEARWIGETALHRFRDVDAVGRKRDTAECWRNWLDPSSAGARLLINGMENIDILI